jgi:outer membrane protein assembly factor BamB
LKAKARRKLHIGLFNPEGRVRIRAQGDTMRRENRFFNLMGFLTTAALCWTGHADGESAGAEWPQWRGPNRDGISIEKGLLKTWPEGGPKVLWRAPLGEGFSGISISGGRAYTMFAQGDDEFAACLDASTGKEIWRFRTDAKFVEGNGSGPRSTPTVDEGLVFVLGAKGKFFALNSKNGNKVWDHDFVEEFDSSMRNGGFSTSALVEGKLLLVEAGGGAGKSIVAFDKKDGRVAWTSHTDTAGYSSPLAITFNGIRQILFLTSKTLLAVSPVDGQIYWKYPWSAFRGINIATPILVPEDKIFLSASYDYGAVLLRMQAADGTMSVAEVWRSRVMKNHFNSSVLDGNFLYGFDGTILKCIEASSGAQQWRRRDFGKGSLILADGHLIVLGDDGKLALVEVNSTDYKEKARAQVLEGKCWTVPTLAGGKLYIRNEKELVCLDMKER